MLSNKIGLNITIFLIVVIPTLFFSFENQIKTVASVVYTQVINSQVFAPQKDTVGNILYKGNIYHIFFHSLIVYPELAFNNFNNPRSELYKQYMITRDEFVKILPELYKNNFVLIDINSIYSVGVNGEIVRKPIYLPEGKKPLIISLDDLSYYDRELGHGFASKLVIDEKGQVATEVITPSGIATTTRTGDVVPILDDFVASHPEFSFRGAKGTIALTGFQGVLGYRTELVDSPKHSQDLESVKNVITKLKATGWNFASHSYSHEEAFYKGTIFLEDLKKDTARWETEVKPLIGETSIFIGPFGQIFSPKDPRREYLVSKGFKFFGGVGANPYLRYFGDYVVMDRADIDGYRLSHNQDLLKTFFDYNLVVDPFFASSSISRQ